MCETSCHDARCYATSAGGLAGADVVAGRLTRAEGEHGRYRGVPVRRMPRKRQFTPPCLAHCRATAGTLVGSRVPHGGSCVIRTGRAGRTRPGAPPTGARRARPGERVTGRLSGVVWSKGGRPDGADGIEILRILPVDVFPFYTRRLYRYFSKLGQNTQLSKQVGIGG